MAYQQSDIDALKRHAARGVKRGKINGEEVEFVSLAEMRRQIAEMEAEVAGGTAGAMNVSYAKAGRGL